MIKLPRFDVSEFQLDHAVYKRINDDDGNQIGHFRIEVPKVLSKLGYDVIVSFAPDPGTRDFNWQSSQKIFVRRHVYSEPIFYKDKFERTVNEMIEELERKINTNE